MKKLFLTTLLIVSCSLFGQDSFIIEYRQKNELDPEKVKEFEKERSSSGGGFVKIGAGADQKYELIYKDGLTLYSKLELINNNQESSANAFSVHVGGQYKDLVSDPVLKMFNQEVTVDKVDYILKSPFRDYQWKITDIEETILGYKTIKAVAEIDGKKIAAWYAPDLKIDAGPAQINGLPGVILKSIQEIGNKLGTIHTYEAEKITLNPKKLPKIKPLNGREITADDMKKINEESRKKMLEAYGVGVDIK